MQEWKWMYLRMPNFDPSGIFVAEDRDTQEIAGSLVLSETRLLINDRKQVVGFIDDVMTLPKWRGAGVATELTRMAIEESMKKGCSAVFLYANPFGKSARIYRRIGFKDARYFYVHARSGGMRRAVKKFPFPMNLGAPIMAVVSGITSRRCRLIRSQARSRQVDCGDNGECDAYLEALNSSLRMMPLFYPYSRERLDWMIEDAPKSVSPVARLIEKSGRIVCGANASVYRMKFFGKMFSTWVIGDLFTSENLQGPEREAYVRSLIEDLVKDGEARDCALHMVLASKYDGRISSSLRPCGFFRFFPTSFMCLPLKDDFSLPPEDVAWYSWKQHMIGVP